MSTLVINRLLHEEVDGLFERCDHENIAMEIRMVEFGGIEVDEIRMSRSWPEFVEVMHRLQDLLCREHIRGVRLVRKQEYNMLLVDS